MATLTKGLQIGNRYVIHEHIGTGGYGAVWKASDTRLGRDVALKRLLKASHASTDEESKRIIEEAKKQCRLAHTNVVQVFDVLAVDNEHFIVMEFVDGRSLHHELRDLARKGETFPLDRSIEMLRDILDGALHAHEHGIIHRDLSPSNILLTLGGIPKLADFGIARAVQNMPGDPMSSPTESGTGNPDFMAPEQARGEAADPVSDLFMIGIVGYMLLDGHHPFAHPSGLFAIRELLEDEGYTPPTPKPPTVLSTSQQRLFREYVSVVMRLLSRERAARYGSARDAINAIDAVEPTQDCPQCSERVPEHFPFCGFCGYNLAPSEPTDAQDKVVEGNERLQTAQELVDEGFRLVQGKHWNDGIKLYRDAIRLDPWYSKAYLNLGFALNRVGQYSEADKTLTQGLLLPNLGAQPTGSMLAARSVARESLKRYDEGLSDAESAVQLQPTSIRALYSRARLRLLTGNPEHARSDARDVLRRDPDHKGASRLLAQIEAAGAD